MPTVRPVPETLREYGRALAGGMLFAVTLLYTMEIWWQGYTTRPLVLFATVVGALGLLTLYCHVAGLGETRTIGEAAFEAVETFALGLMLAAVMLRLTGQLPPGLSWTDVLLRVAAVGVYASVGVAVGSTQLGQDARTGSGGDDVPRGHVGHELTLAVLGAVLVGASVAPTEEIRLIAVEASPWSLFALALLSAGVTLGIVSYVEFRGAVPSRQSAFAGGPLGAACVSYAVALGTAAALLASAGRFEAPLWDALALVVVLGFPCALGASAGRLLL